jgi:hypothetical protein
MIVNLQVGPQVIDDGLLDIPSATEVKTQASDMAGKDPHPPHHAYQSFDEELREALTENALMNAAYDDHPTNTVAITVVTLEGKGSRMMGNRYWILAAALIAIVASFIPIAVYHLVTEPRVCRRHGECGRTSNAAARRAMKRSDERRILKDSLSYVGGHAGLRSPALTTCEDGAENKKNECIVAQTISKDGTVNFVTSHI